MKPSPTVFAVDDDPRVLKALEHLLAAAGIPIETHPSPQRFLAGFDVRRPGCIVCDLAMPRMSGATLQARLNERGSRIPMIFLTGHHSIAWTVQVLQAGAVDFLTKPIHPERLLASVHNALRRDAEIRAVQERLSVLTPRELEVLHAIAAGRMNKEIADQCRVCERTVKFHRANLARKLEVDSTAELIRLSIQGGLVPLGPGAAPKAEPTPRRAGRKPA